METLQLGKVDGYGNGRKTCRVELEIELRERESVAPHLTIDLEPIGQYTELAICGNVWNHIETDLVQFGQMYDAMLDYFPHSPLVAEIVKVWKRWHLNGLKAGTRTQAKAIDAYKRNNTLWRYDYGEACDILKDQGLYEDTSKLGRLERIANRLLKQGKGYKYGHAWLVEPLPEKIIEQVKSWQD